MTEIVGPVHADMVQTPANDTSQGWREIAAGIWGDQKQVWNSFLDGTANAKEAGVALTEEGFGLMAAGSVMPIIGEAAIAAGAVVVGGGVALMAIGNRLDE